MIDKYFTQGGYFGIGIENPKRAFNVGTLWRSASALGAHFIFTVGSRYKHQASDTSIAFRHIPYFHYSTFDEFFTHGIPYSCQLVGIELHETAGMITSFVHPERSIYLLGAEDIGLSKQAIGRCHHLVQIPARNSLNVSIAGAIVMYDRMNKIK